MYHPLETETHLIFNRDRAKLGSGGMGDVFRVNHNHQIITEKYKLLGKFKALSSYFTPQSSGHSSMQKCYVDYQTKNILNIAFSPKPETKILTQVLPDSPSVTMFLCNLQRFWYEVYTMKEITLAQRMQVPGAQYFNPIHEHLYAFDSEGKLYGVIRAPLVENEQQEVQSCQSFARKFQPHLMAHIALQTLSAINLTRDLEILIRDLKPDHILLDGNQIKIIDLGLARTLHGKDTFNSLYIPQHPKPQKGNALIHHSKLILPKGIQQFLQDYPEEILLGGTIPYMSSPSLTGKIDRDVDIWAWLVSMYETASGVYPFPNIIDACNNESLAINQKMLIAAKTIRTINQPELEAQFRTANPLVPASFYTPLCAALKLPSYENIATFTNLLQELAVERTPDVVIQPTTKSTTSDTSAMEVVDILKLVSQYRLSNQNK